MSISIIIPTYNGKERVLQLVSSILEWDSGVEIVVCVDGSTDGTEEALGQIGHAKLRVVSQPNGGRSKARNRGAVEATGQILWFLDDDMQSDEQTLKKVNEHFTELPGSILVGGQYEKAEDCRIEVQKYKLSRSTKWQKNLATSKSKLDTPYITAANFSISSSSFQELRGFDEQLRDTEDYDLALRAKRSGKEIYFDPSLTGWHEPVPSAEDYVARLKQYHRSELMLAAMKPDMGLDPKYSPTGFKRFVYKRFSSKQWIKRIDGEKMKWIPRGIRYRLYDIIFTSQSKVYTD